MKKIKIILIACFFFVPTIGLSEDHDHDHAEKVEASKDESGLTKEEHSHGDADEHGDHKGHAKMEAGEKKEKSDSHAHGDDDEHGDHEGHSKKEVNEKKESKDEHAHGDEDEHGHGHEEVEANLAIPEKDLSRFDLTLKEVKSAHIIEGLQVSGRIVPVDEKVAHVSPRFAGVVKEVRGKVGDVVKADTLLAVIQNNQNLQTFQLYSAIPGVIIKRHATLGETVGEEDVLFIVADLSEVWAELAVYKQDVDKVRLGQKARVSIASHLAPQEGEVIFFSPITEEKTQSRLARIRLKNPDPHFSPGAFVSGSIVTNEIDVPLSVELEAIQRLEGGDNIFVREGESFAPRKVVLGQKDDVNVEVLSGVKVGEKYASGDTFILKAELGKSEAEHEH